MTRFLSESLHAPEPYFRLHLRQLEKARGNPSTDITLTHQVSQAVQQKLRLLGLDPNDTTPKELYLALLARLEADDKRLTRRLQTVAAHHVSAEADVIAGMEHVLQASFKSSAGFAIKTSAYKRLLRAQPPKKVMKQLGYRSLESMLKQESMAAISAAASITESPAWLRSLQDRYKKLTPQDFESRPLQVVYLHSKRWRQFAETHVMDQKHNLLAFPVLGAIILLPLPRTAPEGTVIASLSLALHASNQLQASSTFLKLSQVRPDFGQLVKTVANSEPTLQASLLDKPVSWQLVQRFYDRLEITDDRALFEPHLHSHELSWQNIESALSKIEPSLSFWKDSAHLGVVHNQQPVSLNIIDVALNACNNLSFEMRRAAHFRKSLWQELQLQYLHPQTVEATVLAHLQPKLAFAPALA